MKTKSNLNLKLSGIEYLCLLMQSEPGKSQRYYLKKKYLYQRAKEDPHKGGSGAGYFTSKSYKNKYWRCYASKNVLLPNGNYRAVKSCMHLTDKGWNCANQARQKLGLKSLVDLRSF